MHRHSNYFVEILVNRAACSQSVANQVAKVDGIARANNVFSAQIVISGPVTTKMIATKMSANAALLFISKDLQVQENNQLKSKQSQRLCHTKTYL